MVKADRIIKVEVNGAYVRTDSKNAGVQGESDTARLHITFNDEWSEYGKWIVWHNALGEGERTEFLAPEPDAPMVCVTAIPGEALAEAGWCCFRIEGGPEDGTAAAVTATVRLYVKPNEGVPGNGSGDGTGGGGCSCDLTSIKAQIGLNKAEIRVTAAEIRSEVSDAVAGLTSEISQTAGAIRSEVTDHVNDLRSEAEQTAAGFQTTVEGINGQISTLEQTASSLQARLTDCEGDVNTLSMSAAATVSRIEDAEGDISSLEQRAGSIESRVEGAEGDISSLEQRAGSIESRVEGAEGDISSLEQRAGSIESRVEGAEGNISSLTQTVDGFTFQVSDPAPDGEGGSEVTLTIGMGGNTWSGVVKVGGNLEVTGSVAAKTLYAVMGDVAKLTVDSLSTSRRIPLYLAGDTSDDNFIHIAGQRYRFVCGTCTGGTEQAVDPDGAALYWEKNIAGAAIGSDGYPYLDGSRVFTTTKATAWPVTVYKYKEQTKLVFEFQEEGLHDPRIVFGAGWGESANHDRGRGFFQKRNDCFDFWFVGHDDKETGVSCGDYLELMGLRKPTALNFSGWDSGSFSETLDGDVWHSYSVTFDSANRPIKITDSAGHETTVSW